MRTTHKIFVPFFLLLLIFMLVSCGRKTDEGPVSSVPQQSPGHVLLTHDQSQVAGIDTGRMQKRMIGTELQVSGVIDVPPRSKISISMPYGGFLKSTTMLPGSKVRKGEVIAVVENPEFIQFQQEYLEGLASQEFLKAEFRRQEGLFRENVSSEKNYQQARSQYLGNEARINALGERLRLIGFDLEKVRAGNISSTVSIHAPVTGSITEVHTNLGRFVSPQQVIMDLTDANDLHVELTVYESDIAFIREGQRIRFSLANGPERWREAKVFLVGSVVREDRSVTVHGHLVKMYDDLKPGMYVKARIETGSREVWAVPEQALVRHKGKDYLFLYKGTKQGDSTQVSDYQMMEVAKGATEGGFAEVHAAEGTSWSTDMTIVVKGALTLLAEARKAEEGEGHDH